LLLNGCIDRLQSFIRYGPDAATHDWFEQSHALEIGQINAAPMLDLARCAVSP
jgi:hypothetical protein